MRKLWRAAWGWGLKWGASRRPRSLHLEETLALGEKRYVAIVECQGARFLVGSTAAAVSLLAALPAEQEFRGALATAHRLGGRR